VAARRPLAAFGALLSVGVIAVAGTGCGAQAAAAGRLAAQTTPFVVARAETPAIADDDIAAQETRLVPAATATPAKTKAKTGPVPPDRPALRADWQAGVNLTADAATDFLAPGSDDALQAARADGSTSVEIVATWYMTDATASSVAADPVRTPTDAAVAHAVATAESLGLKVLLKPQVDVLDGTYRGLIAPANRPAWFASYRAMLLHYATLALQSKAAGLVVGVELGSMVSGPRDTVLWRSMIRSVRNVGYRGQLTYAANWDQLGLVGFWRSLDYIGVDAYFPLIPHGRQSQPTIAQLVSAWHRSYVVGGPVNWVNRIARLEHDERRPVVFTELGYVAASCTAADPYDVAPVCPSGARSVATEHAQQDAYVAALRVWSRTPYVRGIYWWDWPTDANQGTDAYSPRGKLAEQTLREWNATRGTLTTKH
jgi:hypothetical protein